MPAGADSAAIFCLYFVSSECSFPEKLPLPPVFDDDIFRFVSSECNGPGFPFLANDILCLVSDEYGLAFNLADVLFFSSSVYTLDNAEIDIFFLVSSDRFFPVFILIVA